MVWFSTNIYTLLSKTLEDAIGPNSFTDTMNSVDDIYLEIQSRLGLPHRDSAKQQLYKMIFGHPEHEPSKRFLEMFPDAGAWIKQLKFTSLEDNISAKKHSNLSFYMQRKESTIFREAWRILDQGGVIFLSVHDEIVVPRCDTDKARSAIVIALVNNGIKKYSIKAKGNVE